MLAILAMVAAAAWPSLERSMADQRLRDSADMVRAEWQHARAKAMESGIAYQFCYTPADRTYWIEPCEDASSSTGTGGRAVAAPEPDRLQLPEQITFAEGSVDKESSGGAEEGKTAGENNPAAQGAASASPDGGESAVPVVFSPDGTCSSAEVTLRNENDRTITVTIHGLTAIAVVGEVTSAEETSP